MAERAQHHGTLFERGDALTRDYTVVMGFLRKPDAIKETAVLAL